MKKINFFSIFSVVQILFEINFFKNKPDFLYIEFIKPIWSESRDSKFFITISGGVCI
jgi:hypothetical protein